MWPQPDRNALVQAFPVSPEQIRDPQAALLRESEEQPYARCVFDGDGRINFRAQRVQARSARARSAGNVVPLMASAKDDILKIRLSTALKERIDAVAARKEQSTADFVRTSLLAAVEADEDRRRPSGAPNASMFSVNEADSLPQKNGGSGAANPDEPTVRKDRSLREKFARDSERAGRRAAESAHKPKPPRGRNKPAADQAGAPAPG